MFSGETLWSKDEICHLSFLTKRQEQICNDKKRQKEGKSFPSKEQKDGITIKNNVLYPCPVLPQMKATMNMAYQRKMFQAVPARMYITAFLFILFIFAPKLLFQISRQAFFFSYSRISPCSSTEYKCLVSTTSYFLLLPCF